jgi:serine/threonine protein kinase
VYEAVNIYDQRRIAVKVEDLGQKLLPYEAKIYEMLNARSPQSMAPRGQRFFAKKEWFAVINGCNCLAFELLGQSVETIMMEEGKRIMFKDVLMLGMQMLEALSFMHSRHMIHRDIKPDNIVSGLGDKRNIFFLIDFGLSKQFRDPKTLVHNPYKENKSLTGTPRYASINNHMGVEQSRRDDLESLAYTLIYLCKGQLPWQGIKMPKNIKDTRKYKNRKILESKMSTPVQELCFGIPRCMQDFLFYVRSLRF